MPRNPMPLKYHHFWVGETMKIVNSWLRLKDQKVIALGPCLRIYRTAESGNLQCSPLENLLVLPTWVR